MLGGSSKNRLGKTSSGVKAESHLDCAVGTVPELVYGRQREAEGGGSSPWYLYICVKEKYLTELIIFG